MIAGKNCHHTRMGNLAISTMAIHDGKIWNNPVKYEEYFSCTGWYVSGDSAYMDEEGYFWFQGRIDDVINCRESV